jgi:hypothetical protein
VVEEESRPKKKPRPTLFVMADDDGDPDLHFACRDPDRDSIFDDIRRLIDAYPSALIKCHRQFILAKHHSIWRVCADTLVELFNFCSIDPQSRF